MPPAEARQAAADLLLPDQNVPPIPIAICGSSLWLPGIDNVDDFVETIKAKVLCRVDMVKARRYPAAQIDEDEQHDPWKLHSKWANFFDDDEAFSYDYHFFRVTKKLARHMHEAQIAILQAVWRALEDAGIKPKDIYRTRTGVFVGSFTSFGAFYEAMDEAGIRSRVMSSLSDHVANFFGTHGPSITMETACASSLVAVAQAVAALRNGDCETAIVATSNLSWRVFHLCMQSAGVLSPTGEPRVFDENANGILRAEGFGAIVLRRQSDAEAAGQRIVASLINVAAGAAGPADGAKDGPGRVYEQPSPFGIRELIKHVYTTAGVDPRHISMMECHATGTPVGDLIELEAVGDALGVLRGPDQEPLRVASVKSNIGHTELAAGLMSLIKVVEMLRRRVYLPSAGVSQPRSDFDWNGKRLRVLQETEPFPPLEQGPVIIGVEAFGIGGGYAHALVTEYRPPAPTVPRLLPAAAAQPTTPLIFPLSSTTAEHAKILARDIAKFVRGPSCPSLLDLCGTMGGHRASLKYRAALTATSLPELADQLEAVANGSRPLVAGDGARRIMFVFTGQGAQWPGVGETLMAYPAYANAARRIDKLFTSLSGWSILERAPKWSAAEMSETMHCAPITFLVQVGLYHLLCDLGLEPSIVVGHSAGEVASAYAAGLITLKEAVEIMYARSVEQQALSGCGRLLAVNRGYDAIIATPLPEGIEIACVNSPQSVVLAGPEPTLKAYKEALPDGVRSSFIPGNVAFHSSRTGPALPKIAARLAHLDKAGTRKSKVTFVSTVTGDIETTIKADYWCKNVRQAVLFQRAMESAFNDQETAPDCVIELGPHRTLLGLVKQCIDPLGASDTYLVSTLERNQTCIDVMTCFIANVFERGVDVEMRSFFRELGAQFCPALPRTPFIKARLNPYFFLGRFLFDWGLYTSGPVAGCKRHDQFVVEVSDRTFKPLQDHNMGGQQILPGTFYVEMALEVAGLPCAVTDVEFKSMCKIPKATNGELPFHVQLRLQERHAADGVQPFTVSSIPLAANYADKDLPLPSSEHCLGNIIKGASLDALAKDRDSSRLLPGPNGFLTTMDLSNLGDEGIKALISKHSHCVAATRENVYGLINREGLAEYGPTFQLVSSVHGAPGSNSYLAVIEHDNEAWENKGGMFSVQMLDSIFHSTLATPMADHTFVSYNAGFKAAYFLRKPGSKKLYAHLDFYPETKIMGRRFEIGNAHLYNEAGELVLSIRGIQSFVGSQNDNVSLGDAIWQPLSAPSAPLPSVASTKALAASLLESAAALRKAHGCTDPKIRGPVVFRFLELLMSEKSSGIIEALAQMTPPEGVVIEGWIGAQSSSDLSRVTTTVPRSATWLRLRKVVVRLLHEELSDLTFHTMVVHDWSNSVGMSSWGSSPEAISEFLADLSGAIAPRGSLWVRGVGPSDASAWTEALAGVGGAVTVPEELVASSSLRSSSSKEGATTSDVVVVDKDDDTTESSSVEGSNPDGDDHHSVLVACNQYAVPPATKPLRAMVLAAEDTKAGSRLMELLKSSDPTCKVTLLTSGADGGPDYNSPQTVWDNAIMAAMESAEDEGRIFEGVIFVAYAEDDNVLGSHAFGRMAALTRSLVSFEDKLKANGAIMWVVTEGAFHGDVIRPAMSTIQAYCNPIIVENRFLSVRVVDMDNSRALPQAAAVIASSPNELNYLVSSESSEKEPRVLRYLAIDVKERLSTPVAADNPKVAFECIVPRALATPGQINVEFLQRELPALADDQVVVDVHYMGLNFRDVMLSISMLPDQSFEKSFYGHTMGMEASGIVSAIGKGVKNVKVGDRVFTSDRHSFANRLVTTGKFVEPLPDSVPLEMAAGASCAYKTAHYSLIDVGQLKAGEKVLVQAGAGGVGLAAIAVCRHRGAIVYATASAPKRDHLRSLGVEHVYDSRSTSWFEDLMRDTNNQGVDLVLNSLAGEHQWLGVQALSPGGRFLEIGKIDIYANNKLGLLALRKNASFAAIDLDRLGKEDIVKSLQLEREVFDLIKAGVYGPLPLTIMPMSRVQDAITKLRSGGVIGKIVLSNYEEDGRPVKVPMQSLPHVFRPGGTYIVTGGAGGFGSQLVRGLYQRGARHFLVTVTRSPERVKSLFSDIIADPEASLEAVVVNTASEEDMRRLIDVAKQQSRPLVGIVHAAGVTNNKVAIEATVEDMEFTGGIKSMGAWYLHQFTQDMPTIETFIVISSIASVSGGRGISVYAAANGFLDGLIRHRRSKGLPGTSFNMASLSDVGMLADDIKVRVMQQRLGYEFVQSARAIKDLVNGLSCDLDQTRHMYSNITKFKLANSSSFTPVHSEPMSFGTTTGGTGAREALTPQAVQAIVMDLVKSLGGHGEVFGSSPLVDLGMDSFTSVEFVSRINQATGVELNFASFSPDTTINDVIRIICTQAGIGRAPTRTPSPPEEQKKKVQSSSAPRAAAAIVPTPAAAAASASKAPLTSRDAVAAASSPTKTDSSSPLRVAGSAGEEEEEKRETDDGLQLRGGKLKKGESGTSEVVQTRSCMPFRWWKKKKTPAPPREPMDLATASRWLVCKRPRIEARHRLICFTWGGGMTSVFNFWAIPGVEVVIMQLPGREARSDEPHIKGIPTQASYIIEAMKVRGYLSDGKTLNFFGVCYGCNLALEIAYQLQEEGSQHRVNHLFLASSWPPHLKPRFYKVAYATPEAVRMVFRQAGALPDLDKYYSEDNTQLVRRSSIDMIAMDRHKRRPDHKLETRMTVLYGDQDKLSPHYFGFGWGQYLKPGSTMVTHLMTGRGHFFILQRESVVETLGLIRKALE